MALGDCHFPSLPSPTSRNNTPPSVFFTDESRLEPTKRGTKPVNCVDYALRGKVQERNGERLHVSKEKLFYQFNGNINIELHGRSGFCLSKWYSFLLLLKETS